MQNPYKLYFRIGKMAKIIQQKSAVWFTFFNFFAALIYSTVFDLFYRISTILVDEFGNWY
jgi:hypothetical protein